MNSGSATINNKNKGNQQQHNAITRNHKREEQAEAPCR